MKLAVAAAVIAISSVYTILQSAFSISANYCRLGEADIG